MAVFAAMFAFVACTPSSEDETDKPVGGKLATPELSIKEQGATSFTIAWNAVSGADAYMVNSGGKSYTTAECEYTFENLNGGEYTVRVKATGKGYDDSDNATIKVTITGLQEADWFVQELIPVTEPTEVNNGQLMVYPFEALFFNWKGTGVKSIQYGLFETAQVETASPSDIKKNLSGFNVDTEAQVLAAINSADGFTSVFNGLTGSTSYTLYALVTNEAGLEYFTSTTLATAEAEVSAEAEAWLGSYSAQTSQIFDLATGELTDEVSNFTFTVSMVDGTPDQVYIDGLSIISATDFPALGQVASDGEGNILMAIWSNVDMGELGNGFSLFWRALSLCYEGDPNNEGYYFVGGNFPAMFLIMDAQGGVTCEMYEGQLSDESPFTVCSFDVIAVDGSGQIGIPQSETGEPFSRWKFGPYTNIAKTGASAAALSSKPQITGVIPTSMVVLQ